MLLWLPALLGSQCGHGAFIKGGRPARSPSITRDEQAAQRAAWERYDAADAEEVASSSL
jgi:hypothetical protein